jgi:Flp pilus assembly protein TadD
MPRSGVHTSPPPRSGAATSPPRSGASSTAPPSIASKVAGLPVGGGPHIPPADEANSGVILPQSRGPAKTPQQQAAEHTKLGMIHLRDGQLTKAVEELQRATDLDSNDADNYARLAWAKFCAATDKKVAAVAARKVLGHAVHKSLKPEIALFYLGRVERMCGRDREALEHFQQVVSNEPKHAEALAEIRVIERTLAAEKAASSGIGGLFKKKK